MKIIDHCLNHNRFIPINTEELTALELIGKTVEKTNEVVTNHNNLNYEVKENEKDIEDKVSNLNNKKVSHDDMLKVYKNNKGDHLGSWQGVERPEMSEPGIQGAVIRNTDNIESVIKSKIYLSNFKGSIQDAIKKCRETRSTLIISEDIVITSTLLVDNNDGMGIKIEGTENKPSITIDSELDIPCIKFFGGSGSFANFGFKNVILKSKQLFKNKGIEINGACYGDFENIKCNKMNIGIHLVNGGSSGTFTELNKFKNIDVSNNIEGVRMEKTTGDDSFHGNSFDEVYFNVYDGQIGFNFKSGYYYNGTFRLYMWSHSENATYLNCGSNCEQNVGAITYESFKRGKITGKGRFWYSGSLTGIGGIQDLTDPTPNGEKVFTCSNYKKPINHAIGTIINVNDIATYNGVNEGVYSVYADNEKSVLINGYNYGSKSRIYGGVTGISKDLDQMELGFAMALNGYSFTTSNEEGFRIIDSKGNICATFNDGKVNAKVGTSEVKNVGANASVLQNITSTGGYYSSDSMGLLSLAIRGDNFEHRALYGINHQGYGGSATCPLISTHYTLNKSGVTIGQPSTNGNGNIVIPITTNTNLTVTMKWQEVGGL